MQDNRDLTARLKCSSAILLQVAPASLKLIAGGVTGIARGELIKDD